MKPVFFVGLLLNTLCTLTESKDSVRLSNVQSLTFKGHGAKTRHRRVPPISQLKCISPSPELCRLAEESIPVMRCQNQGFSYDAEDVQWSCSASLPQEIALTSTDVICEGYRDADDKEVLRGSCGVEYGVRLTRQGEEQYPHLAQGNAFGRGTGGGADDQLSSKLASFIFSVFFLSVLGVIIYSAYGSWTANNANQQQPGRRAPRNNGGRAPGPGWDPGFGGGGWNNDDDNNDPPPPYPGSGGLFGSRSSKGSTRTTSRPQQSGWTPGFWSGLGTGGLAAGAAGYAAGRRAGGAQARDYDAAGPSRSRVRGSGEPALSRPLGSRSRSSVGYDYDSGSGSSFSSTPHTSTGMGGTSRR